jgi:NAD(P)-dependent dehydrogenase (short-subunit alcohol dehydrogenase family)
MTVTLARALAPEIRVNAVAPGFIDTGWWSGLPDPEALKQLAAAAAPLKKVCEPEDVADAVVRGLRDERFLILPHPIVAEFVKRKADDEDRWLLGMRRYQARVRDSG